MQCIETVPAVVRDLQNKQVWSKVILRWQWSYKQSGMWKEGVRLDILAKQWWKHHCKQTYGRSSAKLESCQCALGASRILVQDGGREGQEKLKQDDTESLGQGLTGYRAAPGLCTGALRRREEKFLKTYAVKSGWLVDHYLKRSTLHKCSNIPTTYSMLSIMLKSMEFLF